MCQRLHIYHHYVISSREKLKLSVTPTIQLVSREHQTAINTIDLTSVPQPLPSVMFAPLSSLHISPNTVCHSFSKLFCESDRNIQILFLKESIQSHGRSGSRLPTGKQSLVPSSGEVSKHFYMLLWGEGQPTNATAHMS